MILDKLTELRSEIDELYDMLTDGHVISSNISEQYLFINKLIDEIKGEYMSERVKGVTNG